MAVSLAPIRLSSERASFLLTILLVSWQKVAATRFTVGGSSGWTTYDPALGGVPNYATWSANSAIKVNDTLLFEMPNGGHTIHQLFSQAALIYCDFSLARQWAGTTDLSFEARLTEPGYYYFACRVPGHCQIGLKLSIYVQDTALPPPPYSHPPVNAPSYLPPSYFPYMSPYSAPAMSPKPSPTWSPLYSSHLAPFPAPAYSPKGSPVKAPAPASIFPGDSTAPTPGPTTNGAVSGSLAPSVVSLLMIIAGPLIL